MLCAVRSILEDGLLPCPWIYLPASIFRQPASSNSTHCLVVACMPTCSSSTPPSLTVDPRHQEAYKDPNYTSVGQNLHRATMEVNEIWSFTVTQLARESQRKDDVIAQQNETADKLRHDLGRVTMQVRRKEASISPTSLFLPHNNDPFLASGGRLLCLSLVVSAVSIHTFFVVCRSVSCWPGFENIIITYRHS